QHIPLHDLTVECDERLKVMLPGDTTMVEDLVKFRELFTF
ncbi:MAG: SDR family NAD-dependent epimerase/dehydratase, partial [Gammaproteobacteria bacterium]|nr:SDR family NAD-dependent epimerase/dehydratase [Gammaproteobacteria bacterium]